MQHYWHSHEWTAHVQVRHPLMARVICSILLGYFKHMAMLRNVKTLPNRTIFIKIFNYIHVFKKQNN